MCQKPDTADIIARGQNILIHSVTTSLSNAIAGNLKSKKISDCSIVQAQ